MDNNNIDPAAATEAMNQAIAAFHAPPKFQWIPLILIAYGLAHYFLRKHIFPLKGSTIRDLDNQSIDGMAGFQYTPQAGFIAVIFGIIFFIAFNFEYFKYLFFGGK